jgi:hypothetical protein
MSLRHHQVERQDRQDSQSSIDKCLTLGSLAWSNGSVKTEQQL